MCNEKFFAPICTFLKHLFAPTQLFIEKILCKSDRENKLYYIKVIEKIKEKTRVIKHEKKVIEASVEKVIHLYQHPYLRYIANHSAVTGKHSPINLILPEIQNEFTYFCYRQYNVNQPDGSGKIINQYLFFTSY